MYFSGVFVCIDRYVLVLSIPQIYNRATIDGQLIKNIIYFKTVVYQYILIVMVKNDSLIQFAVVVMLMIK